MNIHHIFKITSIFIFLVSCKNDKSTKIFKNQLESNLLISEIQPGVPEILANIPFEINSYSELNTNNDSLQVYVGEFIQGNKKGQWVAIIPKDGQNYFKNISYNFDTKGGLENQFDIDYNNSKNRISMRLLDFDRYNQKIQYSWIKAGQLSDTLIVEKIKVPLAKGNYIEDIDLTNLNDGKFNINEFNNGIVVLNWWAVTCAPCIKEIPGLNKLKKKYADKDIRFIAITNNSKEVVKSFLKNRKFEYEMMFIESKDQRIFGNSYPKHIVIDSSREILYYTEGGSENTYKSIDNNLINILE
tara:strand:+ start:19571 stop:20470 length:900 start_codon:yes stop_codon:yes gene_type:complete